MSRPIRDDDGHTVTEVRVNDELMGRIYKGWPYPDGSVDYYFVDGTGTHRGELGKAPYREMRRRVIEWLETRHTA